MLDERFEFLLSQYADGTLPAEQRADVEQRLANDADARAELDAHRRLHAAVRASADPLPAVRWDRLAEHLSGAIAAQSRQPILSLVWARRATAWAAAALIFVSVGAFLWQLSHPAAHAPIAKVVSPASVVSFIHVTGPAAQSPAGPSVLQVAVGRPTGIDLSAYADDGTLVVRRPLISLAAAGPLDRPEIH